MQTNRKDLIKIADYLGYERAFKNAGINYTVEPGAYQRGHGDIKDVRFIVVHHTAGGRSDQSDINIVRDGWADLPGPLSQIVFKRNGEPHIIAVGVCWHAYGEINYRGVPAGSGNYYSIGIEGVSNGYNDWTDAQRREYPRIVAALLKDMNLPSDAFIFHREYQPKSKIDPAGFERKWFQDEVNRHYNNQTPQKTAIEECYEKNKDLGKKTFDEKERPCADGIGRYAAYENGAIYWHPNFGARAIKGELYKKFVSLNFENGVLGYPIADELGIRDGGKYLAFQNAGMYSTKNGTFVVLGAIREAWAESEWEKGPYGYPISDEKELPDKIGRVQDFETGHAYWSPETGAKFITGLIWNEYSNQKWEKELGYPLTNELKTPIKEGRYNHFQNGSIYYRWGAAKAFTMTGSFKAVWADLGWENGRLGWPITNQYREGEIMRQDFEAGSIEQDLLQTRVLINGEYISIQPDKPILEEKQTEKPEVPSGYQPTDIEKLMLPDKEKRGGISFFANHNDPSTKGRTMGISGEPADKPWDQWFAAMRFGYVDSEVQSNGWIKPKNIDGIDLNKRIEYKKYLTDRRLKVTNPKTGKSVVVRPADWGPGVPKRMVDVSETAIKALGAVTDDEVTIEWVDKTTPLGPVKQ